MRVKVNDLTGSPANVRLDLALFAVLLLWILWGIGGYGLYEPHEAQYGGGASEMVLRGDWVTPYLNGAPELNKPPLFYWMIASSYKLFGWTGARPEFIARLPLALISLAGAAVAWLWAAEIFSRRAARYAAAMLIFSIGWYIFGHQLLIDELLSTFFLLSLYLLWKAVQTDQVWYWAGFYTVIGLAVLAKGLLGIAFPIATLLIFAAWRRDRKLVWRARPIMGMLLVTAIVAPWAYMYESRNPGALEYIVINEHFRRVFDDRIPHDYGVVQVSAIAFLVLTVVWFAPWCLLLPRVAGYVREQVRNTIEAAATRDAIAILTIGTLLPILFFAAIPSRLIYYGLPALPPFILLVAGAWQAVVPTRAGKIRDMALFAVPGVALLALAFVLPRWMSGEPELYAIFDSLSYVTPLMLFMGVLLLVAAGLLYGAKHGAAFAALIVLMCVCETYGIGQFEKLESIFSSRKLVEQLSPALGDDCIWVSEGSNEVGASSGMAYYLRQHKYNKASQVLIMGDDERRPPPVYPNVQLQFLIDHKRLAELWNSDQSVLFVTDFARTDWIHDKPLLPCDECMYVHLADAGRRRVYANPSAWKRLAQAHLVPASPPEIAASKTEIVHASESKLPVR